MGMRETVGSLRAYFILSGLLSLFLNGAALLVSLPSADYVSIIVEIFGIGFSLAFLYVGFCLVGLLKNSVGRISTLLYASTGWAVIAFLLSLLQGFSVHGLITLIVTLLILWYLLKNLSRLAAEAQVVHVTVPPPGT